MTGHLDGSRERLERVRLVRDALNREIIDYFGQVHPHRVFLETDSQATDEFDIYMEPPQQFPAHWPIVIGEILHNIRSALDNLVWTLSESHSGAAPWPIPRGSPWRKVQFPVYETEQGFDDGTRPWHHFIHPDDWAILKSVQPKQGRDEHRLMTLTELSNADKHRTLHLVSMYQVDLVNPAVWIGTCNDAIVTSLEIEQTSGLCNGKTKLGRVRITVTGPNPKVEVQEQFRFEIAINHPVMPPTDAIGLITWMLLGASSIVEQFATRYP